MTFRFQSLLELRERERDEVGLEVGKVLEAISKVESQITEIDDLLGRQRQADMRDRTGSVSVQGLLDHGRYSAQLEHDRKQLEVTLGQLTQEYERRRELLAASQAEVRRFEILKDRMHAESLATAKRREQEVSDEAAARIMSQPDRFLSNQ